MNYINSAQHSSMDKSLDEKSTNTTLTIDIQISFEETLLQYPKLEHPMIYDDKNDRKIYDEDGIEVDEDALMVACNASIAGNKYTVSAEEAYTFGRNEGKKYAFLTFDDGPSSSITPQVLEILRNYKIRATFFLLGRMVEDNPKIIERYIKEGHSIANHTYTHNYNILYPGRHVDVNAFNQELSRTDSIVKNIIGQDLKMRVVRFPAGSFENWKKPMRDELISSGFYYIDWNVENRDGIKQNISVQEQLTSIKSNTNSAEANNKNLVVLMHDSSAKNTTASGLPFIIEYLISKGYEFRTLK